MKKFRSVTRQVKRGNLKIDTYQSLEMTESGGVENTAKTRLLRKTNNGSWIPY